MYLHIYIERWFLELGFQAKFNHSLKDPGFHLPERGSPARGRRHHLSFPCDFGHGPATPHLEDERGEPIAGSQPCGDSPRISGGFLGTTSEILIQQVWSKSQKLPGSGEYLAGDLRTRVPVFTSSYSKLPPCSFVHSFTWPLASRAALCGADVTPYSVQMACVWGVSLRLPRTPDVGDWGGRNMKNNYQRGGQAFTSVSPLAGLPPSAVHSSEMVPTCGLEPVRTSSWEPAIQVSEIVQAGCIKN